MYYFGARYYDPQIGRFISADRIIQNPASSQSYNRYSYCVNNPLKYTDPTGMYFDPQYPDPNQQGDPIEEAYQEIINGANIEDWIKDYMRNLHDSADRIEIVFVSIEGEAAGISGFYIDFQGTPVFPVSDQIRLDSTLLNKDPNTGKINIPELAAIFAHECYHIQEGNPGATIDEEYHAYKAEYSVGMYLGWEGATQLSWLNDLKGNPGDYSFLKQVKDQLSKGQGNAHNVYTVMPMRQDQMLPMHEGAQLLAAQLHWSPLWANLVGFALQALGVSAIPMK